MSVRSEPTTVPTAAMAAIDVNAPVPTASNEHVAATISAAQSADSSLGDANTLSTSHPDHPLRRSFVTSIRATLGDLCLRKAKGTWAPSSEALRSMLQQKKFVDLGGSAEMSGDLKSIVLHNMTLASVKSDFDVPIGMKITGVDNSTFSLTGEAYSAIVPPKHESTTARRLQEDDVALGERFFLDSSPIRFDSTTHYDCVCACVSACSAYEFSRKFPGYTADNLTEKGIHEVAARRFCLIAADHTIVSAVSVTRRASKVL